MTNIQEELRPYFSLPKVMDGLFNLAKTLFGINVDAADGLAPVSTYYCFFLGLPHLRNFTPLFCGLLQVVFYVPNESLINGFRYGTRMSGSIV